ncbi:MAG: hypothetical protein HC913_09755 [Microscillaceae bacterium]|nr:hypothetical protein [Microscillaceae bacterium]
MLNFAFLGLQLAIGDEFLSVCPIKQGHNYHHQSQPPHHGIQYQPVEAIVLLKQGNFGFFEFIVFFEQGYLGFLLFQVVRSLKPGNDTGRFFSIDFALQPQVKRLIFKGFGIIANLGVGIGQGFCGVFDVVFGPILAISRLCKAYRMTCCALKAGRA